MLFTRFLTYLVTASLGYWLGQYAPRPKRWFGWVGWILLLVLAYSYGQNVRLLSLFGDDIYLNFALQGLILGVILRFALWRRGAQPGEQ